MMMEGQVRRPLNILAAAHMPSVPQNNGYSIRVHALYGYLAKHHHLTWMLPWDYGKIDDPLYENVLVGKPEFHLLTKVISLLKKMPQKSKWFQWVSSLALHPWFFARPGMYYVPEIAWFEDNLREQANSGRYDLLLVEHEILGEFIPRNIKIPVVFTMQNLPTILFDRAESVIETAATSSQLVSIQKRRILKHQNDMLQRADLVVFMSKDDEQFAKEAAPTIKSLVVPNGVDTNYFSPRPDTPVQSNKLVFIGTMNYFPNADAVQYLCEKVIPQLGNLQSEIEIWVIGSGEPPENIKTLSEAAKIHWAGNVEDVRPHLASAAAFIVPLRVGSGTRLKVLTAMSMGIPIISTRIGAEGITAVHGESILLADTPEEFAQSIQEILSNPELRTKLGRNARLLVEQHYSWQLIAPILEKACLDIMSAKLE